VDEVIAVPPPAQCECGGRLEVERIESQYQQEIVRKTIWRRFDIPICRCQQCHKRVQGRDPRQTSDALGAAAVQLGPDALAVTKLLIWRESISFASKSQMGQSPQEKGKLRKWPQYNQTRSQVYRISPAGWISSTAH
jgi:hypothetical protein